MDDFLNNLINLINKTNYQCYVAENPNTPPEALEQLADDEDWFVRYSVARNPNTPKYIKEYLNATIFMNTYYES